MTSNKPSFTHALLCITTTVSLIFYGLFIAQANMQGIMLLCLFWVIVNVLFIDKDTNRLKKCMTKAIEKSSSVLLIYLFIGAIIGAFVISGAIPTLIFYGLQLITPQLFLPIGMILCSVTSLAIGSCWATVGTMGIALIGVAAILNIPLPIAAGMIVSGAYFGDKLSPISDTTILSALVTGTDINKHIKGMTYSLIPAYLFTLLLFLLIGLNYTHEYSSGFNQLKDVSDYLTQHYHIGIIPLLPMIIMFGLSASGKPAELSMLVGVILALLVAVIIQQVPIHESINSLYLGSNIHLKQQPLLENILNRGGIERMLSSLSLTLLILALGGLLEAYQFITVLFSKVMKFLKSPFSLISATLVISVLSNMLMSEAYLSIILVNRIFGDSYKKIGLDSCVLSKAIEEGTTFSTPLIPWTTSGIFIGTTLGISPIDYLSWSLFNWIAPLFFLISAAFHFFGIKMYRLNATISVS